MGDRLTRRERRKTLRQSGKATCNGKSAAVPLNTSTKWEQFGRNEDRSREPRCESTGHPLRSGMAEAFFHSFSGQRALVIQLFQALFIGVLNF
jgi:hypothetical protein